MTEQDVQRYLESRLAAFKQESGGIRLAELDPHFLRIVDERYRQETDSIAEADGVMFLCPKCWRRNGGPVGTHLVVCWKPAVPQTITPGPGRWNLVGTGYDDLSLVGGSSSILLPRPRTDREVERGSPCGWHGFITNGLATDAGDQMNTEIIEEVSPGIVQANAEGAIKAYHERDARNIGGFVNVADDIEQAYPDASSLRLMLNDDKFVPPEEFDRAVAFQKGISATGRKTLVHCRAAVNRSTCVIAAMMVAWGETVDGALSKLPRKPYSDTTVLSLRSWAAARKA